MNAKDLLGINKYMWAWYYQHQNDELITVKVIIFSKTIRIKDCKGIFVLLFGAESITGQPGLI